MLKKISIICATTLLVSCASNQYIIDPKSSTNPENYYADKMECENISEQESYSENIFWGALTKGLITAIGSSAMTYFGIGSGANLDLATSATIGGLAGAVGGGGLSTYETYRDRKDIVRKCMEGRGYNILK
tara:strand:- start:290 stop:682 length:393 start_codon:yes stop_codon:yes gene_type:complete